MESHLPSPANAEAIIRSYREGLTLAEAKCAYGKSQDRGARAGDVPIVERIYKDPLKFGTLIDRIAVARAFMGDRKAWDAMTYYEQHETISLAARYIVADRAHPRWSDNPPYLETTKQSLARGCARQGWIVLLGEALDIDPGNFRNAARRLEEKAK